VAASIRWNISSPAPRRFHPGACRRRPGISVWSTIRPSTTAAAAGPQSSAAFSSQRSCQNHPLPKLLPRQIPIDGRALTAFPRVRSSVAFVRRPPYRSHRSRPAGIRNPCVDGPRLARTCCSWGRVWSIAVMCPALVCGHVDRGPRWVTRIGSQTSRRGLCPKGFPGVFRSSVRPIAILLLSLQAPG